MNQLQDIILEEIQSLREMGPNEEVIQSVKESMLKSHKHNLSVPSYWLFWILDSFKAYQVTNCMKYHDKTMKDMESIQEYMQQAIERRVHGKIHLLENVSNELMTNMFYDHFHVDKAVIIDLRPNVVMH